MKSDAELQLDVMEELRWEPQLLAAHIGVSASNGVINLSGTVDNYQKKIMAEKATWRVAGVAAVSEDIIVQPSSSNEKTDAEIAEALVHSLKWHSAVHDFKIRVKVEDSCVYLYGEVEWAFQRQAIVKSAENLIGVKSICNAITLKSKVNIGDVRNKIRESFQRNANIDANHIVITLDESKVILHGTVRSYAEKLTAERAIWNSPGVTTVENRLNVELPSFIDE